MSFQIFVVILFLVDHHQCKGATDLFACNQVYRGFRSLEFKERGLAICALQQTSNGDSFRCAANGVLDRFDSNATRELSVFGCAVAFVGNSASAVAISISRRHMWNTWVAGTKKDSLATQSLSCGCCRAVFKGGVDGVRQL